MRSLGVHVATTMGTALPLLAVTSLLLVGCDDMTPTTAANLSSPLRFGLFAADAAGSDQELRARYQPVVAYLESSLSRPVEFMVSPDAGRLLDEFENGRLDAVFNRAFAFPHAQATVGALALVTREEDRHVTTVLIASARDSRQSLADFKGARLDFSLRLGSSYVMGRHYFEQQKIDAETYFREIHYSTVADEAIERVRKGQSDLGVANSQALVRMFAGGALPRGEIKIVAETPPHVGQLWFVSQDVPRDVRAQLRDVFLELSPSDPNHAPALRLLGASGFVPAIADDYLELTGLMRQMQLLDFDVKQLP